MVQGDLGYGRGIVPCKELFRSGDVRFFLRLCDGPNQALLTPWPNASETRKQIFHIDKDRSNLGRISSTVRLNDHFF